MRFRHRSISVLSNPPWTTEPWKGFVASNNPGQVTLGVPVLLTQGTADEIVPPAVTEALLQRLCENGDPVELRLLDGIGHLDGGPAARPVELVDQPAPEWIVQS